MRETTKGWLVAGGIVLVAWLAIEADDKGIKAKNGEALEMCLTYDFYDGESDAKQRARCLASYDRAEGERINR